MDERPYHHGNLRTAVLTQAELTVRERGVEALSLRELAREVGVSHGAPRRHFADRQALLDALAEAGFARLGRGPARRGGRRREEFQTAPAGDGIGLRALRDARRGAAGADVRGKHGEQPRRCTRPPARPSAVLLELIEQGQAEGAIGSGEPERVGLVMFAMIQGIAALMTSGIVQPEQLDELVADAIAHFLRGSHGGV